MNIRYLIKSAGVLSVGSGASQLIMLLGLVVLARLYTPAQFGFFALVSAIAAITGVTAAGRYELTILLPSRSSHIALASDVVLSLSLVLHLMMALVLLPISFLEIIPFGPLAVTGLIVISMSNSLVQTTSFIQNKQARYMKTATVMIAKSIMTVSFSWGMAYTAYGNYGLVIGLVLSSAIIVLYLLLSEYGVGYVHRIISRPPRKMIAWLRRHSSFAKFSLPAVFVNQLSSQSPVFLLAWLYGQSDAGIYSILARVITAPQALISGALNRVYMRAVGDLRAKGKRLKSVTIKVSSLSILPALGVAVSLIVVSRLVGFENILGPDWSAIDKYILVFIPTLVAGFISKSISGFAVLGKNALGLVYQLLVLGLLVTAVGGSYLFGFPGSLAIQCIAVALLLANVVQLILVYTVVRAIDRGFENG